LVGIFCSQLDQVSEGASSGQGSRKVDTGMALLSVVQLVSAGPRPLDIYSMIG
jgi:hypothetical protein